MCEAILFRCRKCRIRLRHIPVYKNILTNSGSINPDPQSAASNLIHKPVPESLTTHYYVLPRPPVVPNAGSGKLLRQWIKEICSTTLPYFQQSSSQFVTHHHADYSSGQHQPLPSQINHLILMRLWRFISQHTLTTSHTECDCSPSGPPRCLILASPMRQTKAASSAAQTADSYAARPMKV